MKTIKERIPAILVIIALFGLLSIGLLILSSNKYEDDIARLEIENKKLEYNNRELKNSVEILHTKLNNAYDIECDLGIQEYEKGYIIDGYYYELKEQVGEE